MQKSEIIFSPPMSPVIRNIAMLFCISFLMFGTANGQEQPTWSSDPGSGGFFVPDTNSHGHFEWEHSVPPGNGMDRQFDSFSPDEMNFHLYSNRQWQEIIRSYVRQSPDFLQGLLDEEPNLLDGLKIPLPSLDNYRRIISEIESTNIPEISSGIDFSGFHLTKEQERELRRLLDFSLMKAGIASIDSTHCPTCAGVGQGPTAGPVVTPNLPKVAGTPAHTVYETYVKDSKIQGVDEASLGSDSLRRIAVIELAIDQLIEQSNAKRFRPHYSFVNDATDGIWSWTSVSVVVNSHVIYPKDTNKGWAGFQVTLRERKTGLNSNNSFETVLIVDSLVRRGRGWVIFGNDAPPPDEDFKRMLDDISASNQIEQRIAEDLIDIVLKSRARTVL